MNKRDNKLLSNFKNIENNEKIIQSAIDIQNNINIYANSKAIAIAASKDDISLNVVAYALAKVYAMQNQSTLLIDCNMYNPSLNYMFNKEPFAIGLNNILDDDVNIGNLINHISNNLDAIFTSKTNYPTKIFKSKQYFEIANKLKEKYEHIIFIMPSIIEHQDILMSKELITSVLLVVRKEKVSKKDLFDSLQILEVNELPYVGTIYLK